MKTLYSWVGDTDRNAIAQGRFNGCPLANILNAGIYEKLVLIADSDEFPSKKADRTKEASESLIEALRNKYNLVVEIDYIDLENPTDFSKIYPAALKSIVKRIENGAQPISIDFNVASGTPQMQFIWYIISKTQFSGRTLHSSEESGVVEMEFPFEIKSEFIPKELKEKIGQEAFIEKNRLLQTVSITSLGDYGEISFSSDSMRVLYKNIIKAATHSLPVYLAGEIGTERNTIAQLIHKESERHSEQFIHVRCSSENDYEMDRQIFGDTHTRRNPNKSSSQEKPLIQQVANGTLYLEDVEKLSNQTQKKLCDLLSTESSTKRKLASGTNINVRIIASSTTDLVELVRAGEITTEFYFLISIHKIRIPSLSERKQDLGKIAESLLNKVNSTLNGTVGFSDKHFSPSALGYIENREWPGNLVELHSLIKRLAISVEDSVIKYEDVLDATLIAPKPNHRDDTILNRELGNGFDLNRTISEVAHHYVVRANEQADGNKTVAAKLVGLPNRQTLTYWMDKKFKLENGGSSDA